MRDEAEIYEDLLRILRELNWTLGVSEDNKSVQGMIIGTPEYIRDIIEKLEARGEIHVPIDLN